MSTYPRRIAAALLALALLLPALAAAEGQDMVSSDDILKQLEKKPAPAGGASRSFRGIVVNTQMDTQAAPTPGAPAAKGQEPSREVAAPAQPAEKPQVTVYLYFRSGTAELANEASRRQLVALGKALSSPALAGARFEIGGHTDAQGSDAVNQALSEQRAAFVRDQLVSAYGLRAENVTAHGYGKTQPVAGNDTEAGRAKNRRVVIKRLD